MESDSTSRKVFISYSWTSPDHEEWVLQLATQLTESGIHVILDKWDLREGADKFAFMEKMVTDSSIEKVLMICDKAYAEKADKRKGGVGTETQIITPEIYEQFDKADQQQRFIPVLVQKDENGRAYLPQYLRSRIFVDFSDPNRHSESFEQLIRTIYGKPLHQRPEIGKTPSYILKDDKKSLGTSVAFNRAIDAIRSNKDFANGAMDEYFSILADKLEVFRIEPNNREDFDEGVIENLGMFQPYRDEIVDLFVAIARYRSDLEPYVKIHSFFENLLKYLYAKKDASSYRERDFDNFKFIVEELFLYAIATFIKYRQFQGANLLLEQGYLPPDNYRFSESDSIFSFSVFRAYLESLKHRNQRLQLRRLSVKADLIKNRASRSDIKFEDLKQAEFVLFIRDELTKGEKWSRAYWYPETMVYAMHQYRPFEIFARAESKKYFDEMKVLLNIESKDELAQLFEQYKQGDRRLPQWDGFTFSPPQLMNFEKLATRP